MSVASPAALTARAYSAKVDGVRLAVASLLSRNVPAFIRDAAALLRDVATARRQCSTLQVVRIACLAARVERDEVGVHAWFHTAPSPERSSANDGNAPCWQGVLVRLF